jgi:hypothetical protein
MRRIRPHLTYANVMATLAVFLVLAGGTALGASYVVSSNSQIGPGTVSGHNPPTGKHSNVIASSVNATDLANGAVTQGKLGANSVNSSKVVDGSLNSGDTNTSSIQQRVTGGCTGNNAIQQVNGDGTATCEPTGTITAVNPGTGLSDGGSSGDVTLNADESVLQHRLDGGCASGQAVTSVDQSGASTCTAVGFTQVTLRSSSGNTGGAAVFCNAGETVVGGGADSGAPLTKSEPIAGFQGWSVANIQGTAITAYALCAK